MKLLGVAAALPLLVTHAAGKKGSSALQRRREDGPVEKVVKLLEEIQGRIEDDGKHEQEIYDKYACWCEKTTKRKADAITDARETIRALGQSILKLKGKAATLSAEIETLLQDIKLNEEAQAEATSIRQKENEAWQAETVEMKMAIAALEKAIIVLKGATGSSLLQQNRAGEEAAQKVAQTLQTVLDAAPVTGPRAGKLSPKLALLRNAAEALSSGKRSQYAPQSGTIQGILGDMYDTFSKDLQSKTMSEATANRKFEDFIAVKQEELETMQASVKKKTAAKAEAEVMLSEAIQSYDDTEKQMKADIEFFDVTKENCGLKAEEWGERKTLRTDELEGIAKALEILTSDDAKELFGKAIKPGVATPASLLQVDSDSSSAPQQKAFEALKKSASRTHSLRLATLAASVASAKVGHFDEVLKAIDDMVVILQEEQEADTKKRDACKEEYQTLASELAEVAWKIEKNEAKIKELEEEIEAKEEEKAKTIEEIAEVEQQMIDMKDERKAENEAFLQAKQEDEDAIGLLTEAKDALAEYMKKHATLLQQGPEFEVSKDQAPDATFSDKNSRKGESKGVVALLASIIEDLGNEIKVGQQEEESSQLAFEKALAAAEKLKEELEAKKINLEETIATRKEEKLDEEALKETNVQNQTETEAYKEEIKPNCDWMIENYEKRREQRTAEMDGLKQAKDYLAGYKPPSEEAFVQHVAAAGAVRKPSLRAHAVRA